MARALGPYLEGRHEEADRVAAEGLEVVQALGATPSQMVLLSLRAVFAMARGDLATAHTLVDQAETLSGASQTVAYVSSGIHLAVAARVAIAEGRIDTGRAFLTKVNAMRPFSTAAIGWLAVAMRIHAIRAAIQLREPATARTLLVEAQEIIQARPDLGVLVEELAMLRPMVEGLRTAEPGPWTLTTAELRLLAYLPTHLTFREVAERMHLSPHTIKTQAMSIYGKLEVTSRREAIERAVEVGLLDASVLHQAGGSVLVA
jgi:LuxR family maltose regulon positive regulatory protein